MSMLRRYLIGTLHPEAYHGRGRKAPYFEAWYIKLLTADHRCLALIPGLYRGRQQAFSFVQVVDEASGKTTLEQFPETAFHASAERFSVRVGNNTFSDKGVTLSLKRASVYGQVHFGPLAPWPVRLRAPGAMGWYGWMPMLQCYHSIVSLDHTVHGTLTMDDSTVSFDHGRGYIEKDWGKSFPSTWVWFQCNRFAQPTTCLTGSIARVPWFGGSFPGFIVGLYHGGTLLPFATYTGAKILDLSCEPPAMSCIIEGRTHRLEVTATRGTVQEVLGPTVTGMNRPIAEGLAGPIGFRLYRRRATGDSLCLDGESPWGSLEIEGSREQLQTLTTPGWQAAPMWRQMMRRLV